MASTEQANIPWKEEVQRRRIQNERTRDVERKWEHLINTEGEGAPEWMRETALKKKAARDKLTAAGIPPWMQEVQRRNTGLTKKMHEARTIGEIDVSERAPQPEQTIAAACTKGEEATEASAHTEEQVTDIGDENEREEPTPQPEPPITADCTKEEEAAESNGYMGKQEDGRGDDDE